MADIKIVISAAGAEQASRVLEQVAAAGAKVGSVTAGGAAQAQKALSGMQGQATEVLAVIQAAGVQTGSFGAALGALASPSIAAATALGGLAFAVRSVTVAMEANFRQLRDLQAVSGLSADAADQLLDTFQLLGLSSETLNQALFRLSQKIADGDEGLQRLGISAKTPGEAFLQLQDRIGGAGTATERAKVLFELFGRAGLQLTSTFAMAGAEFKRFHDEAGRGGPSMEAAQRATEQYIQAQAKLTKAWDDAVTTLGLGLLPHLTNLAIVIGAVHTALAGGFDIKFKLFGKEITLETMKWLSGEFFSAMIPGIDALRLALIALESAAEAVDTGPMQGPPSPRAKIPSLAPSKEELDRLKTAEALHKSLVAALAKTDEALANVEGGWEDVIRVQKDADEILALGTKLWADYLVQLAKTDAQIADVEPWDERVKAMKETDAEIAKLIKDGADLARVWAATDAAIGNVFGAGVVTDAERFRQAMDDLVAQARVLGPSFDLSSKSIALMRGELERLAVLTGGTVTPEMEALRTELHRLEDIKETERIFTDVFGTITGAVEKMTTGLIQGTLTIKEAFKNLGQSLIVEFANRVIKLAFEPLAASAARMFTGLIVGGTAVGTGTAVAATGAPGGMPASGGTGGIDIATVLSLGQSVTGLGNSVSGLSAVMSGVMAGWAAPASVGTSSSLLGAASGGWSAISNLAAGASAASTTLAGLGAVVSVGIAVMNLFNDEVEAGIGGLAGAGIGALAGAAAFSWTGPGALIAALIGAGIGGAAGGFIGGLFGGPDEEEIRAALEVEKVSEAVQPFVDVMTAGTMTLEQLFTTLQSFAEGGANAIGPADLGFGVLIAGVVQDIRDVTLREFEDALAVNPAAVTGSLFSGINDDELNAQMAAMVNALVQAQAAMQIALDLMGGQLEDLGGSIADEFVPGLTAALAAIEDMPLQEAAAAAQALGARLNTLTVAVAVYDQLAADQVRLTGTLAEQMGLMAEGIEALLDAAGAAVEDARSRLAESISPDEQLAALAGLRQAILERYDLETRLVREVEASIAGLLEQFGAPLVAVRAQVATGDLVQGDAAGLNALLGDLQHLADTAPTAAAALFAVSQALGVILSLPIGALTPTAISEAAAGPLGTLAELIDAALDAGDMTSALSLLQRQAQAISALGDAAIAGINQLRDADIAAVNAGAAAQLADLNTNWDALVTAIEATAQAQIDSVEQVAAATIAANEDQIELIRDVSEAQIDANNDQIEAVQAVAAATIAANEAQIEAVQAVAEAQIAANDELIAAANEAAEVQIAANDAMIEANTARLGQLQEELALTQELSAAAESIAGYLTDLRLSSAAPINPADQLQMAQAGFDAALAAFGQDQSAANAAAAKEAAAALLGAGAGVFDKPSPEYQALFASVTGALEGVQGTLETGAGRPEDAITAEMDLLTASNEALSAASEQIRANTDATVTALQDANALIRADTDAQVTALQDMNEAIRANADADVQALQDLNDQIRDTAADNISALEDINDQIRAEMDATVKAIGDQRDQDLLTAEAGRQNDIALVTAATTAQVTAIEAAAKVQTDAWEQWVRDGLLRNAGEQERILGDLLLGQVDVLHAITGGLDAQSYLAQQAKRAADDLALIQEDIASLVQALGGVPALAEGTPYVPRTGLYTLHRGEMVVPAAAPLPAAAPGPSGAGVTASAGRPIVINVSGAGDPAAVAAEVRRVLMDELRWGASGVVAGRT